MYTSDQRRTGGILKKMQKLLYSMTEVTDRRMCVYPVKALKKIAYKPWGATGFLQFEIIINVLFSPSRFT